MGVEAKCCQMSEKKCFFYFLSSQRIFFSLSLLLFLAFSGGHSSLSFVLPTASPPTKLHTRLAHIPPPLLHLLRLSGPPPTPLNCACTTTSPFFFLPPRPYQEGLQHNCVFCTWRRHVKGSPTTPLPFPLIHFANKSLFVSFLQA